MAIIGTAHVHIRADDKYFESDVRKATAKIKNVTIQLKADVDMAKASKKIRDLRYRITSKDAVLTVDANVTKAEEKMAKLLKKFTSNDLAFNAVANTAGANTALSELHARYASTRVPITAQANTAAANAALAFAARNRRANINAFIDPKTSSALMGLVNVLTGTINAEKIKAAVLGLATNFEGLATKATIATAAVGALGAAALTTGANIFAIAGDLTKVIGLAAMIPAALGSMASVIIANKMAWKGFGEAFSEDAGKAAEALAKLPPEAQKAVVALRGVYKEVQKPVQNAFWESMGTSLQDMVKTLLPELKEGMIGTGRALGNMSKTFVGALGEFGKGHTLPMFEKLNLMLDNISKGVAGGTKGMIELGKVGSQYLPRFGEWVGELGNKFGDFIMKASESGQINVWIEQAISTVKDLGSIVKSTTEIFSGLTDAARMSGAAGLPEFAAGLRNIRDIVNGEPFQSRLITILEGARRGTEKMAEGLSILTKYFGNSSVAIGIFLEKAGKIAGLTFESIEALFNGTGLGTGIIAALTGLENALVILKPGFADLGAAIGILGEISGELFRSMAPGLNQIFETIRMVVQELRQGILDAMPVFNEFIQAILAVVQGPIVALADGIGTILELFADLPSGIQTALMAFGLFLLLKSKFDVFFNGIKKNFADMESESGQRMRNTASSWNKMTTGMKSAWDGLPASAEHAMIQSTRAIKSNIDVAASYVPQRLKDMGNNIKSGFATFGQGLFKGAFSDINREFDPVRTGFTNLAQNARNAADNIRTGFTERLSRLGEAIVPADSALRRFSDNARNVSAQMSANLAPARDAWTNLGNHITTVASNTTKSLGGGIKSAASGLFNALGGGWGAALGAATIALGLYAAALAESDARVKSFAGSLDQSTGAITLATKKLVAENALDGATNGWDDFFRGVLQGSASVEETLGDLGISLKDHTEALSDPTGRESYVKGLVTIADALNHNIPLTEEMAAAIGSTKEELKGVTGNQMRHLADKAKNAAEELKKAEQEVRNMAKATGTTDVQAAALAKNMETLTVATSSASDKFSALKQNLDITTGGMRTARETLRDQQDALLGVGDNIKEIGKKYGGLIVETGKLDAAFAGSILTKEGTFSSATKGAIDFSREMDSVADAILRAGSGELDTVLKKTGDLGAAQAASMEVMRKGTEQLRQSLIDSGIEAGLAQQIIGQLGLNPDQLQGALMVDTKDAEHEIMRFEMFKDAVLAKNWEVALAASTNEVKNAILTTEGYKKAYEEGGWEAVVKLKDETGKGFGDLMAKIALAKDESEVTALLKAEFPGAKTFEEASKAIETYNMTPTQIKEMKGTDSVTPIMDPIMESLRNFGTINVPPASIRALDETAPAVESAKVTTSSVPDFWSNLFANDSTQGGKDSATRTTQSLEDVWRDLFSTDKAGAGKNSAQGTMNSLKDVWRELFARNSAESGKISAQNTIDSTRDKTANIYAANKTHDGVQQANNTIGSVVGKTVDIITRFFKIGENADGGIWNDGVRTFANGGILNKVKTPNVKAYAGGGVENHVAQIARGAWPARVWAEPETGGEAYLPLHPSKRKRSLAILDEVATLFGYSLVKRMEFAEGGIMKTMAKTPSIVSNSSVTQTIMAPAQNTGGPTVITHVHPSAGLNEGQIADSVSETIYWKLSTQI